MFTKNKFDLKRFNYACNVTFKEKLTPEELKITEKVIINIIGI